MRRIYMDNAATSFPKPPAVHEAMARFATEIGASPGRGAYAEAKEAGRLLQRCRERINTLIGGADPDHVVFTLNTTDALNMAIHGLVRPGGSRNHVITTDLDHNSILRPFNLLAEHPGIEQTRVPCDPVTGLVDPDDIRKAVRPDTALIAVLHGSNVTGTLQPVRAIGRVARDMAVPFLVDAAQTLGHLPIDVEADCIDLLAAPGHKGLLGPLGTGFLYIRPGVEKMMDTVRQGGTGSVSELDTQPDFMPDRFEPGSHNAIGIVGLSEGVAYILDRGVDRLWQHEQQLIQLMLDGLDFESNLTLFGPPSADDRCGVFSVRIEGFDQPQTLSDLLERDFGLLTRSGIHCAPHAHATVGTASRGGATRLSLGPFLTGADIRHACHALNTIGHQVAAAV